MKIQRVEYDTDMTDEIKMNRTLKHLLELDSQKSGNHANKEEQLQTRKEVVVFPCKHSQNPENGTKGYSIPSEICVSVNMSVLVRC